MEPIFTHPQSGLQVCAVNQNGEDFPYTFYDSTMKDPVPLVILYSTQPGHVTFHLVNTSQQRAAAYMVAITFATMHTYNVINYGSNTARPPFQRELNSAPDVVWIEGGRTYILTGMTSKHLRSPFYPFDLKPMKCDNLRAFTGPYGLSFTWIDLRFYPGDNYATRQAYDLCIGFKGME